jgi:coenzyme F420-dependent glucose-6-phosphate dehydrogenase
MALVGFHASHEEVSPRALLDVLPLLRPAGFEAVSSSDHASPWLPEQGQSGYAWSWLGAAMASCDLPFGVVSAPGQRQHPAVVAQAIGTLTELFPERLWVALGSGENLNEHITGDRWPGRDARQQRLAESVSVIRRLLDGDEVTHHGEVDVDRARVWSLPDSPAPLRGAAVGPETAAWAASWADGLITVVQETAALQAVLDAYRGAGGAGPVAVQVHVSFDPDAGLARDRAFRLWRAGLVHAPDSWDLAMPGEFAARTSAFTRDDIDDAVIVASSSAELADRLVRVASLGFDEVYVHQVGGAFESFLEAAYSDLVPVLRGIGDQAPVSS